MGRKVCVPPPPLLPNAAYALLYYQRRDYILYLSIQISMFLEREMVTQSK